MKYPGRVISGTKPVANANTASAVWILQDAMQKSFSSSWPKVDSWVPAVSYIGSTTYTTTSTAQTVNYPAGTQSGDLVVHIHGGYTGSPATPSGFTQAFATGADPAYAYYRTVSYKIAGAETSVSTASSYAGFEGLVIVIRGKTAVSSTYQYTNTTAGGTTNFSVAVTGVGILHAPDRGATNGGYPTLSGSPDSTISFMSTYIANRTGIYLSYVSGSTLSITDYNDTYLTSGLLCVVT